MILVSACLAGVCCKYSGGNNYNEKIFDLVKKGNAILVCPEQLGGLATPRAPAEIRTIQGKRYVMTKDGEDVTENFKRGANEVLKLAKSLNIKKAVLKSKSPSCGYGKIYDGTFSGKLISGNGILADMLIQNGVEVVSSEEFEK